MFSNWQFTYQFLLAVPVTVYLLSLIHIYWVQIWLSGDPDPVSVQVSGVAEITLGQTVFMSRSVWDLSLIHI